MSDNPIDDEALQSGPEASVDEKDAAEGEDLDDIINDEGDGSVGNDDDSDDGGKQKRRKRDDTLDEDDLQLLAENRVRTQPVSTIRMRAVGQARVSPQTCTVQTPMTPDGCLAAERPDRSPKQTLGCCRTLRSPSASPTTRCRCWIWFRALAS